MSIYHINELMASNALQFWLKFRLFILINSDSISLNTSLCCLSFLHYEKMSLAVWRLLFGQQGDLPGPNSRSVEAELALISDIIVNNQEDDTSQDDSAR